MATFSNGRTASFTCASDTLVTANFYEWVLVEKVNWHPSTPFVFGMDKFTAGTRTANGLLASFHDPAAATPPSPSTGAPGDLVLTLSTGKTKTFKASLVQCHIQVTNQNGGPPLVFDYAFIANANAATDTIATA